MKNTFGQSVTVTLFGESHGAYIGAVLDGLAPGMEIDEKLYAQLQEICSDLEIDIDSYLEE